MAKFFGTPSGVKVGALFIDRRELHVTNVHRPTQGGISGNRAEGADSIVVSGGYVDDEDHGDYVIYTGHGGKDPNSRRQISHQSVDAPGNAGLVTSHAFGLPIRLVRGPHSKSPYAPSNGYQYGGLFTVTDWWIATGKDGFDIVRFRLDRLQEQPKLWSRQEPDPDPAFATSTVSRRIRDTQLSRYVKTLYSNQCQICGVAIPGIGGRSYSEGAHVKPLGRPHLGGDTLSNLLCLCPNHHTQLDIGGLVITDNFIIIRPKEQERLGQLNFIAGHFLDVANAQYHREHWSTGKLLNNLPT